MTPRPAAIARYHGAVVPTSWKSPIGRLRAVALAEGVSFLVLLGIAMPLNHLAGMPLAVRIAGWIHGILFIAVCFILSRTASELSWARRQVITVVVAALLPFGPFVIDRRLSRLDRSPSATTSPPRAGT